MRRLHAYIPREFHDCESHRASHRMQAEQASCVTSYIGDRIAGGELSPQEAAAVADAMHVRALEIANEARLGPGSKNHPQRSRILWPATLLPCDFPAPAARRTARAGPSSARPRHGTQVRAAAEAAVCRGQKTARLEDLAGPGPGGMLVRMVAPKRTEAAAALARVPLPARPPEPPADRRLPASRLDVRTPLDWVRFSQQRGERC